jgi:hypothetical protein
MECAHQHVKADMIILPIFDYLVVLLLKNCSRVNMCLGATTSQVTHRVSHQYNPVGSYNVWPWLRRTKYSNSDGHQNSPWKAGRRFVQIEFM